VSYETRFSEDADTKPLRGLQTSLEAFLDKSIPLVRQKRKVTDLKNFFPSDFKLTYFDRK